MEHSPTPELTNPAGGLEKVENHPMLESRNDSADDTPVCSRPINVHSVSDAKRLLSRIIREVQNDTMTGKKATSLTYLLTTFVQIAKQSEFDARLEGIEKKLSIELSKQA